MTFGLFRTVFLCTGSVRTALEFSSPPATRLDKKSHPVRENLSCTKLYKRVSLNIIIMISKVQKSCDIVQYLLFFVFS